METDGKRLLDKIATGDEQALADFYHLFEDRIYRYAHARLNDPFTAADILNEVMLEVWKQAARFEGRSKLSTWLLGITRYKVLDRLRQRQRQPEQQQTDERLADDGPSHDTLIASAEDAEYLRHCLEKLPEAQREVMHLAFFEDLGYRDIASLIDCPEGTVKSRVFHAKEALKRCLSRLTG